MIVRQDALAIETKLNSIRIRFQTLIATPQSLPTGYDNDLEFQQPSSGVWARLSIRLADAMLREIGATKRIRHAGVIFVQLFDELGRGDKRLLALTDQIDQNFRDKLVDSVTYREVTVVRIGQETLGQYQMNVHIGFQFDEIFQSP